MNLGASDPRHRIGGPPRGIVPVRAAARAVGNNGRFRPPHRRLWRGRRWCPNFSLDPVPWYGMHKPFTGAKSMPPRKGEESWKRGSRPMRRPAIVAAPPMPRHAVAALAPARIALAESTRPRSLTGARPFSSERVEPRRLFAMIADRRSLAPQQESDDGQGTDEKEQGSAQAEEGKGEDHRRQSLAEGGHVRGLENMKNS